MFDLTTPEGVQAYLEQTPFAASKVDTLTGGSANFTYRITLRSPFLPPGLDALPIKTLVLKHAEPYVASFKEIPFAVERQEFECLAFKLIPELVGPSSIVALPTLYHEDREHSAVLMTDSGPESVTLKAALQSGPVSDVVARDIGTELGVFIARLHKTTRNPPQGTVAHTAKAAFAKNMQARTIVASFYFDRILPTFTDVLSPPLVLPPETVAKLDAYAKSSKDRVINSSEILNMGDYWTGNMLLVLNPAPHVLVVDWEATRPGFPAMDLGSFLAELHLIGVFHPQSRACVDIIIAAFTAAYRAVALQDVDRTEAERLLTHTAYDTAARLGTHLVTLTPVIPWGGPELTREVVQEGVEYILHSVDGDEGWLRRSLVGGFWE